MYFPFFKNLIINLGWFFIPFSVFVIVGSSNAVNLTDGLDGLATITNTEKGIKNHPRLIIKFLKNGKYKLVISW